MDVNLFRAPANICNPQNLLHRIDFFNVGEKIFYYFYHINLIIKNRFCKHLGHEKYLDAFHHDLLHDVEMLGPDEININVDDSFFRGSTSKNYDFRILQDIKKLYCKHLPDHKNYRGEFPEIKYFIPDKFSSRGKHWFSKRDVVWQGSFR